MDLISEQCFLKLSQIADGHVCMIEKINHAQDSYWKDIKVDYDIEEYDIENINDLQQKIQDVTALDPETARYIALVAIRKSFDNDEMESKTETRAIKMPDFVYRM